MVPLFQLNLTGLKGFKDYLESLTAEEIEALGTISRNGSGRKAFNDVKLETLLEAGGFTETNDPDVSLKLKDGDLEFDYVNDAGKTQFAPGDPDSNQGLIRNSTYYIRNVEWVSFALRQAYDIILSYQRDYLAQGKVELLKPITQREVANQMSISDTTLCRLINGKTFRALDGTIMPISSLVLQEEDINRLRACEVMSKMMRDGTYPSSDEAAIEEIYSRTGGEENGVRLARRTITKYRQIIETYVSKKQRTKLEGEDPENTE
jgi:hypothetical protein